MNRRVVYSRKLEDGSGFGVFERIFRWSKGLSKMVQDDKWESCLGVGITLSAAWTDYRARR